MSLRDADSPDLAQTILYSAANVRGVFACNREDFKTMVSALEVGGVKPVIDKVGQLALKETLTVLNARRRSTLRT